MATKSGAAVRRLCSVNIDRVAKLAGTTARRSTGGRRRGGELVVGLLVSQFGSDPAPDSGSCAAIFSYCSSCKRDFFSHPVIKAG